ncbi:MAG: redoxin domain-containing protein [Bacteroidota bacterium]
MNKIALIFTGALLIISSSLFSQGYKIEVQVEDTQDTIMYLVNYNGDKQYIKDTVDNQGNGTFIFKGDEKLPQGIYLAARQDKNYFEFLVTEDQKFKMSTTYDDMVKNMEVKGSKENKYFYDFLQYANSKNQKISEIDKEIKTLLPEDSLKKQKLQRKKDSLSQLINDYKENFINEHPETFMAHVYNASRDPEVPEAPENLSEKEKQEWEYNYYTKHYFDNLDLSDERLLYTPVLHQRVSNFINEVLIQDPDTIIKAADRLMKMANGNKKVTKYLTWYITYNAEQSDIMGMDEVFVHMVDNHFGKEKTPWVSDKVMSNLRERADILRNLLIGKEAPNMLLQDTAGNNVPLHSIDAKYLAIYFWEPGCGHCERETPKLQKIYHDLKDEGFKVYSVCIDRNNPEKWKNYIRENDLDWINVYDGNKWTNFRELYDLVATPTIYLLDKDKKILAKRINSSQLEKFIAKDKEN